MKIKFLISLLLLAVMLTQCYYDHEGILYPETNCDLPANPSFALDVFPILDARCNNCHGGSFPSNGIRLDTYEGVLVSVNNGSLMGSINQTGSYSPMPKNSPKISNCDITGIQAWIDAGAPNN